MSDDRPPVDVAILAFAETSASVVYGFYDLFHCAGRDWGLIVDGRPGPTLMAPRVVSARGEPFVAGNGVRVTPDATLDYSGVKPEKKEEQPDAAKETK